MRGSDSGAGSLFSYVDLEARIAADHPLRQVRELVNEALGQLDASFDKLYSDEGRPGIPPERLLRASLPKDALRTRQFGPGSRRRSNVIPF